MENNQVTQNKKGFLQNDRKFVCSMLVVYGICIIGLIFATFWGLDRRQQAISANETVTAAVAAAQQAKVTSTAIARATEQAQYEFIERFDHVSARWYVGPHNRQYGDASYSIKDGVYIWNVHKSGDFSFWRDFYKGNKIKDFDVYLDARFVESESQGFVCAGLAFRKVEGNWNKGAFVFSICNDSHFQIQYYDRDGWSDVTNSNFIDFIQLDDWNRIEVSAAKGSFPVQDQ